MKLVTFKSILLTLILVFLVDLNLSKTNFRKKLKMLSKASMSLKEQSSFMMNALAKCQSSTFKKRKFASLKNKNKKDKNKVGSFDLDDLLYSTLRIATQYSYAYNSDELIKKTSDDDEFDLTEVIEGPNKALVLYAKKTDTLIISYRGTFNYYNVLLDIEVEKDVANIGGKVHKGFKKYFKSLRAGIKNVVDKYIKNTKRVIFTGHSLGAAVATYAASRRVPEYQKLYKDMKFDLITYGSPRVGDAEFAKLVNELPFEHNIRVVYNHDLVATVPGGDYVHVGTEAKYLGLAKKKFEIGEYNKDNTKKLIADDVKNIKELLSYLSGKDISKSSNIYAVLQAYLYANEVSKDKEKKNEELYYRLANQLKDHMFYCISREHFVNDILRIYRDRKKNAKKN